MNIIELKKLIYEYDYLQSQYEYKEYIISQNNIEFNKEVSSIISNSIELLNIEKNNDIEIGEFEERQIIQKDDFVKVIYKQIAKLTHPDIINNKILNDIYVDVTNHYHDNDKVYLIKKAIDLNINVNIDQDIINEIEEEIKILKSKNSFIENHIMWNWTNNKEEIIIDHIKNEYLSKIK